LFNELRSAEDFSRDPCDEDSTVSIHRHRGRLLPAAGRAEWREPLAVAVRIKFRYSQELLADGVSQPDRSVASSCEAK
jgi:hypothetical protein